VAKLGPNLMLFRFKVKIDGVLCLLDLGAMHSFVSPSAITRLEWVATKVAKPFTIGTRTYNTNKQLVVLRANCLMVHLCCLWIKKHRILFMCIDFCA